MYNSKPVEQSAQTELPIKALNKTKQCKRVIADIVDKNNTQVICLY